MQLTAKFINAPKQKKKKTMKRIKVALGRSPLKFILCVSNVVKIAADIIKDRALCVLVSVGLR